MDREPVNGGNGIRGPMSEVDVRRPTELQRAVLGHDGLPDSAAKLSVLPGQVTRQRCHREAVDPADYHPVVRLIDKPVDRHDGRGYG